MRKHTKIGMTAALVLSLAACGPGGGGGAATQQTGPVSKSVGSSRITLTVWDQNTDPGIDEAQGQLNAAFHKKYPNVTIKRVSRSFSDLKTTLKLALSGDNPPDVVQANQGYPDMGAFVKAGFLRSLNSYSKLYGWGSYYPEGLLKLNSFSSDGKTWQGKDLYGVSQTGELVGLYYNKQLLSKAGISTPPKTLDELDADLTKVKAAGTLPISYGALEKSPGIHLYGFVLSALAGATPVQDLVSSRSGSWTGDQEVSAAQTVSDWASKGYLTKGANGVSKDAAVESFGKGESAFLITGTWNEAALQAAPQASDIGFTALTPSGSSSPVTMGGEGLAWAMTSKTKHGNAAAAYINFITDAQATETLVKLGNLPAVVPADDKPTSGTLAADITSSYNTISQADGVTPYLDYATPTFYDTITAAAQDLVAGKKTAKQFTQALQDDYAEFDKSR